MSLTFAVSKKIRSLWIVNPGFMSCKVDEIVTLVDTFCYISRFILMIYTFMFPCYASLVPFGFFFFSLPEFAQESHTYGMQFECICICYAIALVKSYYQFASFVSNVHCCSTAMEI